VAVLTPRPGFATGLALEAALVRKAARAARARPPPVTVAGPGAPDAAATVAALEAQGAACIVSFGLAGALAPELRAGDVLFPVAVTSRDTGQGFVADPDWRMRLGGGDTQHLVVSSRTPLLTPADKAALWSRTAAHAVDMETFALAEAAHARGLPFVAIRAISDTVDMAIPASAAQAMTADGRLNVTPIVVALVTGRDRLSAFRELGRQTALAKAALARTLAEALSRLSA
jgi:adenosylhomocysteine nucleosidase